MEINPIFPAPNMTTTASYERPPVEVALLRGALSPELQPGGGERPLRHSEISERESATTFQTVSDMGHRDWIKSLRDGKASATLSENLWKPIKVEVSSIRSELNKACVKPARHLGSEHAFLPLGHLLRILSPKNVDGLLRQKFPGDLERFDHQVYGKNGDPKRLKIMGTLILMENLEFLRDFVQAGVEDLQLPLALEEEEERIVLFDRHGNMIESPHKWSWGYGHADFFMYKQMQVCSLFCTLKEDGAYMDHFRLPGNFILPFRNCKPPVVKYGGFGQVIKVEIEPSHLLYKGKSRKPEYFCVKTIRHDVPEHPDEADSLARRLVIRDRKDREHLHRLLFSFRRVDFYYLVFEWADGDLTELWQEMPKRYKPSDHEHVCWFLRQCVGIMRSLHGLQNHTSSLAPGEGGRPVFYDACHGRHSDLKPENILWFKNYQDSKKDHLVIADLGLTQFRTTKSKSRVAWADVGGYTEAYKAPESDVKHVVGGKYDIWGIGCVFLLHASVFLRGDAGCIEEFSERRKAEANKHPRHGNCVDNAFYYLVREGEHGDISSRTSNRTQYRGEVKKEVREVSRFKTTRHSHKK